MKILVSKIVLLLTLLGCNSTSDSILGIISEVSPTTSTDSTQSKFELSSKIYGASILDKDQIFVVGEGVIYSSENSGQTWTTILSSSETFFAITFQNKSIGYTVTENSDVYRSLDEGNNWQKITGQKVPANETYIGSDIISNERYLVYSYNQYPNATQVDGHICLLEWASTEVEWICPFIVGSFATNDGIYSLSSYQDKMPIYAGGNGRIFSIYDANDTFVNLHNLDEEMLIKGIALSDSANGLFVSGDKYLRLFDGSYSLSKSFNASHQINDIAYLEENIFVVVGDNGLVMYTKDYGNNWIDFNISTNNDLYSVTVSDKNIIVTGDKIITVIDIDEFTNN